MADDKQHDINAAQLLQALRQPLFIQTPLQAVLENVLTKLQSHTEVLGDLSNRVARLQRVQVEGSELLLRVQTVERRLDAAAGLSSPMGITDLAKRLTILEEKFPQMQEDMMQQHLKAATDVQPRLVQLEEQLKGVYNLSGHIMAVSEIAEELGIDIPQQAPTAPHTTSAAAEIVAITEGKTAAAAATAAPATAPGAASAAPGSAKHGASSTSSHRNSTSRSGSPSGAKKLGRRQDNGATAAGGAGAAAAPAPQQQQQQQGDTTATETSSSNSSGQRPSSALRLAWQRQQQEWQEKVDAQISALQKQMKALEGAMSDCKLQVGSCLMEQQVTTSQLRQQLADLRRNWEAEQQGVAEQLQQLQEKVSQPPEISLADFNVLESTVKGAMHDIHRALADTKALQDKDVPALTKAVAGLEEQVAAASGVSEMDRHLAAQLAELQGQVEGLSQRLVTVPAAELAQAGLATQADFQEVVGLLRTKASQHDLKVVLQRSVEMALEAYREATGEDASASKTRCLVCDRQLPSSSSPRPGSPVPLMDAFASGSPPGGAGGQVVAGFNPAEMRRQRAGGTPQPRANRPTSAAHRPGSPTDVRPPADAHSNSAQAQPASDGAVDGQQYIRAHTPGSPGSTVRYSNSLPYNHKGQRTQGASSPKAPSSAAVFNLQLMDAELQRPSTAGGALGGSMVRHGQQSARSKRPPTAAAGQPRNPIFL